MRARSPSVTLHRVFTSIIALAAAIFLLGMLATNAQAQVPGMPANPSLMVKMIAGLTAEQQADVIARNGGTEIKRVAALRIHVVEVLDEQLDGVYQAYLADPQVQRVEINKVRQTDRAPTDPMYSGQWALPKIGFDQIPDDASPAGTAVVAVLDTGIDANHPDLAGRVVGGTSILDGSNGMTDPSGHGTAVAGVIAAQNNNEGIAGAAFAGVSVMPVTVLNSEGLGQDSDVIAGVIWAADNGANVIVMAFSNPGQSESLQEAIDYAWSQGVVLVAAAGNDAWSNPSYPAGDRGVMGVAATDENDALAGFSNTGTAVFMGAPGTNIMTTAAGGGYGATSGTSSSAAYVAAAAALMKAFDPSISNGIIVNRLARTADPVDGTGNGRLNLARALADTSTESTRPAGVEGGGGPFVGPYVAAALNTNTVVTRTAGSNPSTYGNSVTFTASVTGNGGSPPVLFGDVEFRDGSNCNTSPVLQAGSSVSGSGNATFTTTLLTGGSHTVTACYLGFGSGGSAINPSNGSIAQTVNKQNSTTTITNSGPSNLNQNTVVGQGYTVFVTVAKTGSNGATPTGTVTVSDGVGGSCTSASLSSGSGSCVLSSIAGSLSIVATYNGDTNYNTSASPSKPHTVIPAVTTTTITNAAALGTATVVGQAYAVNYSVTVESPGGGTPTGGVTVSDGINSCTGTVAAGTCSLASGTAGAKTLVATYPGDANYNASASAGTSHTVNKASTTTTITNGGGLTNTASVVGQAYVVNFSLTVNSPGAGTPPGNVTVSDGTDSCSGTIASGTCTLTSTTAGSKTLVATYVGDANYNNSASAGISHAVNKANTTTTITNTAALATASTVFQGYTVSWSVAVSAPGGGTVTGSVQVNDGSSSCTGPVPVGSCVLTPNTTGAKTITATYGGSANFIGSSGTASHTVNKADQTITVTTHAPANATYNTAFTVDAAGGASGNPVSITALGSCAIQSGGLGFASIIMTSGTGFPLGPNCTVRYNQAGNGNYNAATQVEETTIPQKANQSITVLSAAPASMAYNGNFIVSASAPLGPVAITTSGACTGGGSISATVTMTSGTGVCTVSYNQPGNNNYNAAPQVQSTTNAVKANQTINVTTPAPGTAAYNSTFNVAASATSTLGVAITTTGACSGGGTNSATITVNAPSSTCTVSYNQAGDNNYSAATQIQNTTTATKANQTITVTTAAPASAGYNGTFGVAATASTGFTVSIAASGACSGSGSGSATITITSGSGVCSMTFNQAGDANYNAAPQVTNTTNATKANQTISVTQNPPATATFGSTFTVAATASSGLSVSIASASAMCSGSGTDSALITMTGGTGTCKINFNQAGDANYNAAVQVQTSTGADKAGQTITVTTPAPLNATFGASFGVAATADSGIAVAITSSGACLGSGAGSATITMSSGTGTCAVTYNQAGNANYSAASQVTETTSAQLAAQVITFGALGDKNFGDADFGVTATGGASGNPVTFTASGACTVSGSTVHITTAGSCTITAHQAGDANYSAAADVPLSFNIADTTPPETLIGTGPTSPTNSTTAAFTFSGSDDVTAPGSLAFECKLDSGSFASCASPATYTGFSEGAHTFYVRAIDAAGNVDPTPAQFSWTIDLSPPTVLLDSTPPGLTNQTSATFAFHASEPSSTLECKLDGGSFVSCASPQSYTGLGEGAHTFYVRATDQAGNLGPETSFPWTIDTTAPTETIQTAPDPITNSNTATFTFASSEAATFVCQLDSGTPAPCTSGVTYSGLTEGMHSFTVTATDAAGNSSAPANFPWLVDLTPPDTTITSGSAEGSTTTDTSATFEFDGTDNFGTPGDLVFECSLDSGPFVACTSPATYSSLSRTPHTFAVRAKDLAGNYDLTPAVRNWTVTKMSQTITVTQHAPASAIFNTTFNVAATGGASGNPVVIAASGACSGSGNGSASITMTSGTGTCTVTFNQAGDTNYFAASEATETTAAQKAGQTITVTTAAPASAVYNTSFNVAATGGASGNPVVIAASGVCSGGGNGSTSILMTSGTGTCTVSYDQPGDANYSAATQVTSNTTAQKASQSITVTQAAPSGAIYNTSFNVAATGGGSGLPVVIATSGVCSGSGNGSISVLMTNGTGSCTVSYDQAGDANYSAAPQVTSNTTAQKAGQSITVTQAAPSDAVYNTSFNVSATGGGSPNPVTIATSGVCSGSGNGSASVLMTSGTGTCTVSYNQTGDSNFNPAPQVTSNTTAQKASQSIAVTLAAPASAIYNTSFNVSATGGASPNPVVIAASGVCSGGGNGSASILMTSGTGTCTVSYNQAGDLNFNPAPQVTSNTTAQKANQAALSAIATPNPVTFGFTSALSTTGGTTGGSVTFYSGASTGCSVSGTTLSVGNASGTCAITATMAGDTNYNPVTSASLTVGLLKADQAITGFAPASPVMFAYNGTFNLSASGGASGNAVTFSSASPTVCTVSGVTVTMVSSGSCVLNANQAGNNNYNPAPQASATVVITAWTIQGFFQPVDMGDSVYNSTKGGSTVPLKFRIFAGSIEKTSTTDVKDMVLASISCSGAMITDDIEETATGGTVLRYDTTGSQFIFNWKTPNKGANNCYRMTMIAKDGSQIHAQFTIK